MFPRKLAAAFWMTWCSLLVLIVAGLYWSRRDPTEKFANMTLQMMSLPGTNLVCAWSSEPLLVPVPELVPASAFGPRPDWQYDSNDSTFRLQHTNSSGCRVLYEAAGWGPGRKWRRKPRGPVSLNATLFRPDGTRLASCVVPNTGMIRSWHIYDAEGKLAIWNVATSEQDGKTFISFAEDRTGAKPRNFEINEHGVVYVEEIYNDRNRKVVVNGNRTPEPYRQKPPLKQVN